MTPILNSYTPIHISYYVAVHIIMQYPPTHSCMQFMHTAQDIIDLRSACMPQLVLSVGQDQHNIMIHILCMQQRIGTYSQLVMCMTTIHASRALNFNLSQLNLEIWQCRVVHLTVVYACAVQRQL